MFSSINFLFLSSLAVTSWIILCYIKQIEEQRGQEINELKMERTFEETLTRCHENYDIYLNFFCIFACIYALARVTNFTENYIAKKLHAKFGGRNQPQTLEDYQLQHEHFIWQIRHLQRTNIELQEQLQQTKAQLDLQQSQAQHGEDLENVQHGNRVFVMTEEGNGTGKKILAYDEDSLGEDADPDNSNSSPLKTNKTINNNKIFISNRHIHLNRPVYVNEGNVKLNWTDTEHTDCDFPQIWSKYLDMQKFVIKTPSCADANESDQEAATTDATVTIPRNPMPIVVSTEQLQKIQGWQSLSYKNSIKPSIVFVVFAVIIFCV